MSVHTHIKPIAQRPVLNVSATEPHVLTIDIIDYITGIGNMWAIRVVGKIDKLDFTKNGQK